jgi:hypothetical protein
MYFKHWAVPVRSQTRRLRGCELEMYLGAAWVRAHQAPVMAPEGDPGWTMNGIGIIARRCTV